jgi:hypothetical protein
MPPLLPCSCLIFQGTARIEAVDNLPQTATIKQLTRDGAGIGVTSLILPAGGVSDPFTRGLPTGSG